MSEYCASEVVDASAFEKAQLSFHQLMYLTRSMKPNYLSDWVWPGIQRLNRIRNQLVHKLSPHKHGDQRDQFIRYVQDGYKRDAKPQENSLFDAFPEEYEKLGVAIFLLYTALSVHLNFRPQGLAALTLLERSANADIQARPQGSSSD